MSLTLFDSYFLRENFDTGSEMDLYPSCCQSRKMEGRFIYPAYFLPPRPSYESSRRDDFLHPTLRRSQIEDPRLTKDMCFKVAGFQRPDSKLKG